MDRYYGSIVAGAALVVAGLAATQTDLLDRVRGDRPAAEEKAGPIAEATAVVLKPVALMMSMPTASSSLYRANERGSSVAS